MDSLSFFKDEVIKTEAEYYEPMDTNEEDVQGFHQEPIDSYNDENDTSEQTGKTDPEVFTGNLNSDHFRGFVTGFNIFGEDEALKKIARAKRFSLPFTSWTPEDFKEQSSNLNRDLGIDKENERHYRFNTIHMRGTENMSTEDVLEYFASYAPSHVEWINDVSCNVVWMDDVSAARALLNMSKRIKNLDKVHLNADPFEKELKEPHSVDEELSNDDFVDARNLTVAIPPGFWRIGIPCEKSAFVLLRYATRSDKKQKNAEKNSIYYKKYGNPNFGNLPGILSKSLRKEFKKSKNNTDSIWKKSEGDELKRKNPWEDLAFEWGKTDKTEENDLRYVSSRVLQKGEHVSPKLDVSDLRVSLKIKQETRKRERLTFSENSPNLSSKKIWESKNKILRMKMYADEEEKKIDKKFIKKIKSNQVMKKPVEDLRSKINRKKNKPRLKFRTEKERESSNSDSSDSERDCDGNSDDWALKHYYDLRESLKQNKNQDSQRYKAYRYQMRGEEDDTDENKICIKNLGRRSPLQIEINNDEYYQKT